MPRAEPVTMAVRFEASLLGAAYFLVYCGAWEPIGAKVDGLGEDLDACHNVRAGTRKGMIVKECNSGLGLDMYHIRKSSGWTQHE